MTLDSVVAQTIPPRQWIIVDDGSTDQTAAIVAEYAEIYPWIRLIRRQGHGNIGGVSRGIEVKAFYEGFRYVDLDAVEYIGKLDGDLVLDPDYFERLLERADNDPKLGIVGGVTYFIHRGRRVPESVPVTYVGGMCKLWRVACFRDIGGIVTDLGWDVLDVIRAQMRGWETRSYPELQIRHLRPTNARPNWIKGRRTLGRLDYSVGYHPLFELARCLYRMTLPPYIIGGLAILFGYTQAAARGEKRIASPDERRFLQKQQLRRLLRLENPYRR